MVAATAQQDTIQQLPDAKKDSVSGYLGDFIGAIQRDAMLPPWGTRRRERVLRAYYRHELNTLIQGAINGLIEKVKAAPWEISGPKSGVAYFQDVLRQAQFGAGWGDFLQMTLLDYLRQDIGAFIEVIGPGPSDGPITGRVTGLAHLDALRCYSTGDPEYPVIYHDQHGKQHLMHWTRVIQFIPARDGDEQQNKTVGMCALSRAIAVVQRELYMNRYVAGRLDDNPKPGLLILNNLTDTQFKAAVIKMQRQENTDLSSVWGQTVVLSALQPEFPASIESIAYSEPPEKFDFKAYKVEIDVPELAMALGIDVQELWPLTGNRNSGTSTQSEILHAKSQGKTFGAMLRMLERAINNVLPPEYEFQWKYSDPQDDLNQAQIAQAWATTVQTIADLSPDEKRRILANKVQAIQDAITDEDGQIVRLGDADPVDEAAVDDIGAAGHGQAPAADQPSMQPAVQPNATQTEPVSPVTQPAVATDDAPENVQSIEGLNGAQIQGARDILIDVNAGIMAPAAAIELLVSLGIQRDRAQLMVAANEALPKPTSEELDQAAAAKAWEDTRSEFVTLVMDTIEAARGGDMAKRRFSTIMRAHLRRLGLAAFRDGLEEGGVNPDDMDDRDQAALQEWIRIQSPYVTNFANRVFDQGLSDAQVAIHAEMWGNKSLRDALQLGQASAAWNQVFEWVLGPTEESCPDCLRLATQRHRMRDWRRTGWLPGAIKLACHGFNCLCKLVLAAGKRSRGRF